MSEAFGSDEEVPITVTYKLLVSKVTAIICESIPLSIPLIGSTNLQGPHQALRAA